MKDFCKKNLLSIAVLFSSFFVAIAILYSYNLDTLQKISSILGSVSIVIALSAYIYKKEQDKVLAVIEQISFFRKEVIPKSDEFIEFVRAQKGENYTLPRIKLDNPTIKWVKETYPKEASEQWSAIRGIKKIPQNSLLNTLEEFSIRVIHTKTENHQSLISVKKVFIDSVEICAIALVIHREILSNGNSYPATLELYELWKNDIDRRSLEERTKEALG